MECSVRLTFTVMKKMRLLWYFILLLGCPRASLGQVPAAVQSSNSSFQLHATVSTISFPQEQSTSSPVSQRPPSPLSLPNELSKVKQVEERLPAPQAQVQNRPNFPSYTNTIDGSPGDGDRIRERQQFQYPFGFGSNRDRTSDFGQVDNVNRFNSIGQDNRFRPQDNFPSAASSTTGRSSFSNFNGDINNNVNVRPGSQDTFGSFGGGNPNFGGPPVSINPSSPFGNIPPSSGISPRPSGILKEP